MIFTSQPNGFAVQGSMGKILNEVFCLGDAQRTPWLPGPAKNKVTRNNKKTCWFFSRWYVFVCWKLMKIWWPQLRFCSTSMVDLCLTYLRNLLSIHQMISANLGGFPAISYFWGGIPHRKTHPSGRWDPFPGPRDGLKNDPKLSHAHNVYIYILCIYTYVFVDPYIYICIYIYIHIIRINIFICKYIHLPIYK